MSHFFDIPQGYFAVVKKSVNRLTFHSLSDEICVQIFRFRLAVRRGDNNEEEDKKNTFDLNNMPIYSH